MVRMPSLRWSFRGRPARLAAAVLSVTGALLLGSPSRTQEAGLPFNEVRALNLARNTGVILNGGLTVYHPAVCMFTTSAPGNPCIVSRGPDGFVFRFLGGPPGWQVENLPPTFETELLVAPDGRTVTRVIYNGPPR